MQVNIKCKQVVEYNQTVEMTEEDFNTLQEVLGDDVSERSNPVEFWLVSDYINPGDIIDADDEFLSVEVYAD